MGIGGFPGSHPNYTGLVGMHGSKASNKAISECDLFICLAADSMTVLWGSFSVCKKCTLHTH